ncbi:MAG: TonB-dependent receptor plug domain-containing protein [Flavobacteriaceae bacterium]|nr:MAG: TonB-dependent receptor plug domain-containing protein [Flavobacteriaceae bacterium]
MRFLFFKIFLFASFHCFSQTLLKGIVKEKQGSPVFAANVYVKSAPEKGTVTDFDGKFSLPIHKEDTLVVSYVGFQTLEILLNVIDTEKVLEITLLEAKNTLEEIVIKYTDPISEQFSVVKMDMLKDVYLNPVAQGDPLKAITIQPFSTNTDETANPSLRGSSGDRSRVVFNGVPIINPVRASNLENQGFFSLLNPEIIEKQYVYASNPSLTFGNTSAGLVEIETKRILKNNSLQLSTGLAGTGFMLHQQIKKKSFVQVYGNYQFSEAYIGIQEKYLPAIRSFSTKDFGLNFHSNLSEKVEFNSFGYFIDEDFSGKNIETFTYIGDSENSRKRFFTVNSVKFYTKKGTWQINNGISIDKTSFEHGNSNYKANYKNIFTAIHYKWFLLDNTDIQFGISHDHHSHIFKDTIPTYYYAISPESPSFYRETTIENTIVEGYVYMLWKLNNQWSFSSAIRRNIPTNNQESYMSSQTSFKFKPSEKHYFLLSGGEYHSYSVPNSLATSYNLLKSFQLAFDYHFDYKNTLLKIAAYFKKETGEQNRDVFSSFDKATTFGVEFFIEQQFLKYFKFTFANSFINQEQIINDTAYPGNYDLNYFFKTNLQYTSLKFLTIALGYIGRPGGYYTPINGSNYHSEIQFYEPVFAENLYSERYKSYSTFNFNISKFLPLKNNSFVFYASVNNIFNQKNQRVVQYNKDYSLRHFDNYSNRTFYFGMVWKLNY